MADQHDLNIANQPRTDFRADANAALLAIGKKQNGPTAPGTMHAFEDWADTTAQVMRRRNAANSGWLVRDTLAETFVLSRSSNTILALTDFGRAFIATAGFVQTFTAAGTLGDGWHCYFRNGSTVIVTLDPNGSEQIDGATTIDLQPGEGCEIWCNGSAFFTIGRSRGRVLLDWQVASSSAQIDFANSINSAFSIYEFDLIGVIPATDNVELRARVSTDLGVSFVSTGSYQSAGGAWAPTGVATDPLAETAATSMLLHGVAVGPTSYRLSNSTSRGYNGRWRMFAPADTARHKMFSGQSMHLRQGSTNMIRSAFGNGYDATTAVNAIRFFMSSGNIASGLFRLYGLN